MTPGMTFSQGALVLVPFPFSDLSNVKRRPAVVVSPDWFNAASSDIVLVAVTSNPQSRRNRSIDLSLEGPDLQSGSLVGPSVVKVAKLFTCEKTTVERQVARLTDRKTDEILQALRTFFST